MIWPWGFLCDTASKSQKFSFILGGNRYRTKPLCTSKYLAWCKKVTKYFSFFSLSLSYAKNFLKDFELEAFDKEGHYTLKCFTKIGYETCLPSSYVSLYLTAGIHRQNNGLKTSTVLVHCIFFFCFVIVILLVIDTRYK